MTPVSILRWNTLEKQDQSAKVVNVRHKKAMRD